MKQVQVHISEPLFNALLGGDPRWLRNPLHQVDLAWLQRRALRLSGDLRGELAAALESALGASA